MPKPAATLLVVEDEQIVAVAIEGHLQQLGYKVAGIAASGEEACKQAAQFRPDLVLMDVHIEGPMDGIEAARQIRESLDVPVVFLTAYSDVDTVERAKITQPYGYIVKPFDPRDLHTTIEMALCKGDADRRLRESHENLRTILDAQRHGTVMLEAGGKIRLASQAALKMAKALDRDVIGQSLSDLFPMSPEQATALEAARSCPQSRRRKIALEVENDGSRPRHLEIEIVNDPRDEDASILFLYDVSPLSICDGNWTSTRHFRR